MNLLRVALAVVTVALLTTAGQAQRQPAAEPARGKYDYPVQPVPFTKVRLDDVFWAPRIETNRKVTIPAAFQAK